MSNTEQAQEPTMEEILASIRRIISDDDENAEPAEEAAVAEDVAADDFDSAADGVDEGFAELPEEEVADEVDFDSLDVGEDESNSDADDVLELTEIVAEPDVAEDDISFEDVSFEEDAEAEPADSGEIEFVAIDEPAETEPDLDFKTTPEVPVDTPIMSQVTDSAVASAFGQLASTLLSRDGSTRTLEELVQELLRPMLKSWLDENLPPIVEDLVRQEIERAARRGGR